MGGAVVSVLSSVGSALGTGATAVGGLKAIGGVVSAVSGIASAFGGQDAPEPPSLPPPPPVPTPAEVEAPPPPPKQVSAGAEEAIAAEQARTRSIRQRRAASRRGSRSLTGLTRQEPTLLGE